jgi:hypothetical protein
MARQKGSRTGHCQGCNHVERARIERLLAAGASIKGTARKFDIDYHALRRHWINHVSPEARAAYIAGAGATKDQLEAIVADESLALVDHYRITRSGLYRAFSAACEAGDGSVLAMLAGRLHENFRDCGRLTGELQRGPLFRERPTGDVNVNLEIKAQEARISVMAQLDTIRERLFGRTLGLPAPGRDDNDFERIPAREDGEPSD